MIERLPRALVIANVTVDESYAVDALPALGESIVGTAVARDVGGKGANVAIVLARAGVPARLLACVGDDERAVWIRERLAREPLELELQVEPDLATDVSLILSDSDGDNAIVTTVATTRQLEFERGRDAIVALAPGDVLCLQGNLQRDKTLALMRTARAGGIAVAFNPSPLTEWSSEALPLTDLLFLNIGEARALAGDGAGGLSDDEHVLAGALLALGPRAVVLTRGALGSLLATRSGKRGARIDAVAAGNADVLDTTGAGDTFLAAVLASMLRRAAPIDAQALRHATAAAALTVSRRGTLSAFPSADELDALFDDG